ncbi:VOC family protein [Actinoplanes sp. NPDC051861]|uniref:VOC family protein n=1 Tax=Actinoplanes sp. NPDC051861 TaxID=3155170 RepID=UPI003430B5FC
MSITTVTHINLRGNAREALEFYQRVFGGDLVAIPHAEDPGQVLWGQVTSPAGFHVMAFDVPPSQPWSRGENPFFVSVRGTDTEEVSGYWKRLAEGSTVVVDLAPSQWSPLYGMVTDRFGVTWVLDVA